MHAKCSAQWPGTLNHIDYHLFGPQHRTACNVILIKVLHFEVRAMDVKTTSLHLVLRGKPSGQSQ